ncbi:MAG: CHAT domain-containing protein [Acidobacteriota bacterium]|nr:CHAT domain-containing protein [Acidobacteriota bacterium]
MTALVFLVTSLLVQFAPLGIHPSFVTAQPAVAQGTAPLGGLSDSLEMIRDLLNRGRGIEAENVARALLARVESLRGLDAIEVAEVLDLLWRAVRRSSKVTEQEKRDIVERAVAIKEIALGPWHPDLATSLINLGVQRALADDPAAAKPLLERALAIREAAFGRGHLLVAGALQSLAGVLITLHDDAGAKLLLERAQQNRETAYGADRAETVRSLVNLAMLYQETGDYSGARQRYERAVVLAEKIHGPADLPTVNVLTGAAVALSELGGDFAGSAKLNERLLALTERSFGPMDPRLRAPLENLSLDLRDLGDYAAAKLLAERSLAIAESAFDPNQPEVADSLHTLATVLAAQGEYGGAMRLFERATRIMVEVSRSSDPEVSRAAWFIRDLFPVSGYGSDDAGLFEQAVVMREKNRGLADSRTAESLTNLAAVLSSVADYTRTRPLFERALAAQEKALGPDHPEVAGAATNLAYVLSQVGDGATARPLYERALSIWEKALGPDHPRVATALLNLAGLHSNARNYDNARPLVARALNIQLPRLGAHHPDIAATLTTLAELAGHAGATVEAFETAARAEVLSREHMRLTARTLSERQAMAYASSRAAALDVMLSVAAMRSSDSHTSTGAWEAVIRARGMILDEMAARNRVAGATDDQEAAALTRTLTSARQRLAAAVVRGIRNDPPERYRRLLDQARSDKDRAERDLAEKSAKFREDESRSRAGLPELSAALPAESALVGFVRYRGQDLEASYLAFVLRGGDSVPAVVPLGSAARVDGLVLRWRQQLDQEAMAPGRAAKRGEAAYRRVAGELRQQVWDPLLPHLSKATRVFIVPDGALHLVSFAALPSTASRYLVEAGPLIHYLSAERDLLPTEAGRLAGAGLLALGSPAFDESTPSPGASTSSFRGVRSACSDFQSMRFDPLPASLQEVDQVVTLWNQVHGAPTGTAQLRSTRRSLYSTRLTGAAASESAFKAAAAGRRVLHLATHGFFLGGRCGSDLEPSAGSTAAGASASIARENPLLLSGLILAGANHRDVAAPDQEDGVLTAEEVAAMNLNGVEWAVLSGCDTGVGEVRAGEGVFGLRRAFQVAGAKTVIMSLWPVEDQATRQWMTQLYQGRLMKKLSTADAVRDASLAMLRQRRAKGLSAHPFHWAAFVAAGDWR